MSHDEREHARSQERDEHDEHEALERKPGRSFTDPRRPLGEELIDRAARLGGDFDEGLYGRAPDHYRFGLGVPECAKGVAVLRKAEELMYAGNPPGDTAQNRRRALELAAGRCGVKVEEYDRIVESDEELMSLEAEVMDFARRHSSVSDATDVDAGTADAGEESLSLGPTSTA